FHYDPTMVRDSLRRAERRRRRQVGKRKGGLPGIRKPIDVVRFSTAADMHKSQYVPWELIENDIVMHDIFGLAESDTRAGDKVLDAQADEIVVRLHEVQKVLTFFAIKFIMQHTHSL